MNGSRFEAGGLPRPGQGLLAVMSALGGIWVLLAVSINLGGGSGELFASLCGNRDAILHGELWRLLTAGLVHQPSGPGSASHLVFSLLGLYFLGASLEREWGSRAFVGFLAAASVVGYATQLAVETVLPAALGARLGSPLWFGAGPAIEAVAVAWALNNPGRQIRMMLVLPISASALLAFVIGMSVLRVVGADHLPEGIFSPFGGMLAGWALGGGTPSPARRLFLRARYWMLARRAAALRGKRPDLKVILGGASGEPDGPPEPRKRRRPPTDKRFLN